jgi:hypothetical protein
VLIDCHRAADDLLGSFPTAIEQLAAILFVLARNEFRLEEAAADLPLAAALVQARCSDIHMNEVQQSSLKNLQDDIAEGLSWEDTIVACESILSGADK